VYTASVNRPAFRRLGGALLRLALFAAGAAALAFTLRDASWARTREAVGHIGVPVLLVAVPQAFSNLLHASAWQRLLAGLDARRKLGGMFGLYAGCEAVRMTLPGGPAASETLSVWLLKARFEVPVGDAVSSVAVKKLVVMLTNVLYAGLAFALVAASGLHVPLPWLGANGMLWLLGGSIATLLVLSVVFVAGMSSGGLASRFGKLVARVPWQRAKEWAATKNDAWQSADSRLARPIARGQRLRLVVPSVLLLGQWFVEAGETWLILRLCGADVGIVPALTIEVCGSLLRSAAFALPGGVGVQDAGYVALLQAFAVPDAASFGAAFVLLKRGKELVWSAIGYGVLTAWGASPRAIARREEAA
jgi:glycosyltransferase 2 family protein